MGHELLGELLPPGAPAIERVVEARAEDLAHGEEDVNGVDSGGPGAATELACPARDHLLRVAVSARFGGVSHGGERTLTNAEALERLPHPAVLAQYPDPPVRLVHG